MRDGQTRVSSCGGNLENATFFKLYAPVPWRGGTFWRGLYLSTESKIVGWQIACSNIHAKARAAAHICPPVSVSGYPSSESWSWHGPCATTYLVRAMPLIHPTIRETHTSLSIPALIVSPEPFVVPCPCVFSLRVWHTSIRRIHWEKCVRAGFVYPLVRIPHQWVEGCRRAKSSCPFDEKQDTRGFAWQLIILVCATFYSRVGETCRCHPRLMFFCRRRNTATILGA